LQTSDRTCLACKGKRHIYNYHTLRYTSTPCGCCQNGSLPFDSSDDGYGPLSYKQHILTTEIVRNNRTVGKTSDIRNPMVRAEHEIVVSLNGVFTVDELVGMASMLTKLRGTEPPINCDCCKQYERKP
jgi:hypothetical protein